MVGQLLLLGLGFVFLIKGADLLVDGAGAIAKRLKISNFIIGLTVVSFGTSAPELIINLLAGASGSADIAIGNVLGSNIANIFLILGLTAVIHPIYVKNSVIWREVPFSMLAVLVLAVLANDMLIDGAAESVISRSDGFILLGFFIIFMYYVFILAINRDKDSDEHASEVSDMSLSKAQGFIVLGLLGLAIGGNWIVESARTIAEAAQVSESLISLTLVAIGTSLPELAASIVAALKRQTDIAVGNVVGSNIFNIFWIVGFSATINPIAFNPDANFDLLILIGATIVLFLSIFYGKKHDVSRTEGGIYLALYIVYLLLLIVTR